MALSEEVQGSVTVAEESEGVYSFHYSHEEVDIYPFSVTIDGYDEGDDLPGGETLFHTFQITPMADIAAGATVFSAGQDTENIIGWERGIEVIEKTNFEVMYHNYIEKHFFEFKDVTIIGKRIELVEGDEHYELYCSENTRDIINLTLIGEEVIIGDDCRVKGANITIYARDLRMENGAVLSTTPEEKTISPGMSVDGANGLAAGDINLFVNTITAGDNQFSARGARDKPLVPGWMVPMEMIVRNTLVLLTIVGGKAEKTSRKPR